MESITSPNLQRPNALIDPFMRETEYYLSLDVPAFPGTQYKFLDL